MEEKKYCIYAHINKINGKVYVGQSCNVEKRWSGEGRGYIRKGQNTHFSNAIKKYGWDNFEHVILMEGLTIDEANEMEAKFIEEYDSMNKEKGYNSRAGGSNSPISEETKAKLREAQKGKYDGEKNPFYGKKHSPETIARILEKNKSKFVGEKNPMYGKTHTEESKRKMSEAKKGKYAGEKSPNFGKPVSEETRAKLSAALKGKYVGEKNPNFGKHLTEEQKEYLREINSNNPIICVETQVEYRSLMEAARQLSLEESSIMRVCQHKQLSAGGLRWYYAEEWNSLSTEEQQAIIDDKEDKRKCKTSIRCIETGVVYNTIKEASDATGIYHTGLSSCCQGKAKTAGGFHWEYVNKTHRTPRPMKRVRCVETGEIYENCGKASKATGVNSGNISDCCKGNRPRAGKLHWEYVD